MKRFTRLLSAAMAIVMLVGTLPAALAAPTDNPPYDGTTMAIKVTVRNIDDASDEIENSGVKLERTTTGQYEDLGTRYTGADGTITWEGLVPGFYRITQLNVPDGYKENNSIIERWFGSDEALHDVVIGNYPNRNLTILRLMNGVTPVKGARFEVRDTNNVLFGSDVTDENGMIVFSKLPAGNYTVREVSTPTGVDPVSVGQNPQSLTVSNNQLEGDYSLLFNSSTQPALLIRFLDRATGEGIDGAVFTLRTTDGNVIDSNIRTADGGNAVVPNLEAGSYVLNQTYMPRGYVNDLQSGEFTVRMDLDGNIIQTFYADKLATLTTMVVDSSTGEPLAGAKVYLYDQTNTLVAGPVTSNGDGMVSFSNLAPGNYSLVVNGAPAGYVMDTTTKAVTITDTANVPVQTFTATMKASITIYSKDEDGNPLGNCTFAVRYQNGTKLGSYTTNTSGYVQVPELEPGYYVIEQETVPDGYVMTTVTQTIRVTAGAIAEATFVSRIRPFIVVNGYVAGTTIPVPGAVYEVWDTNNNIIRSAAADASGQVVFEDLTPGTYVVKCVSAPSGYTLNTGAQTVVVTAKRAGFATFTFDRHSSIVINAIDSETGDPLVGAIFQIRSASGTVIEQVTTGADGYAVSSVLDPGRYIVQQFFSPDGYVADVNFQTITVENNKTAMVTFTQSEKPVIVIYATDARALPIAGVQYAVYDGINGDQVASVVTDTAGIATTAPLTPGTYTVKELSAPEGYLLTTSYQTPVVLYGDAAAEVRFPHTKQDVVLISTVDMTTRQAIGGAQYTVTNLNGDLIGDYTASADGTVEVGPLVPGDYIVKQTVAPDGYRICTESQTIKVVSDKILNLTFANYKLTGIVIEAVEQSTHTKLANVTFEIYDEDAKQVFHGTTDTSGILATGDLPAGKYTIKQLSTPDGYTAVETTKVVTVSYNDVTTVVFEQKANTGIIIELTDASTNALLAGGVFKVQDINGNIITTVTTNSSGTATVSGLTAGKYMITQEVAPDGYNLEGNYQWAEVKTGVALEHVKFTNRQTSGLVIRALDRANQAPLAGVIFEIHERNGKLVKTVTTDATGTVTIDGLAPGEYLIKEAKGPEGYQIEAPTQTVTITHGPVSTITFLHTANSDVTLRAVSQADGGAIGGVVFRVTLADGTYVGEYTTAANGQVSLPDLDPGSYVAHITKVPSGYLLDSTPREFTITTGKQVLEIFTIDEEGGVSIRVTNKQTGNPLEGVTMKITTFAGVLVGNYTTDEMGYIKVALEPGQYVAYQTYGLDNYTSALQPYNFEVDANGYAQIEIQLEQESHIRVKVVDSYNGKPVYGVQVEILTEGNNFIGRYATDNEGYIYLDDVLPDGRYKLKMLSVPAGYTLDAETKTIVVSLGETTDVVWPLAGPLGQLTITTLSDSDNVLMGLYKGSRLASAVYTITDMTGTVVTTIYSDSYGEAHSGALEAGTYYVQQVQAPAGYMLNNQRVTVNISSKNDDVKMTVYNKSGNFATTIESHGPKTVLAGNMAKFYWTNIANKSSVPVNNFFYHIIVPTDGGRASTFYTGTYTGVATTYYIEYKTNFSDYQVLANGLNSKSQYSFDLSSIAMGLQGGEYVTDIRVVFPTAAAGMRESMAPTMYVSVLPNVFTGYQLINRAEAGCQGSTSGSAAGSVTGAGFNANTGVSGMANGWTSSSSQSITMVQQNQYPGIPDNLPKTGS